MSLYKNLKQARIRMGKSQQEVAEEIGISNTALSNYETGYRQPDWETLRELALYYGVSLDELADLTGEELHPLYDLWKVSSSKKIAFRGRTYQLRDSQKVALRKVLTAFFNGLKIK